MPQGTLNPAQNYDHLLVPMSGYDGMHDLQYKANVADGEAWFRGAITSLNQDGEMKAGCGDLEMPLFAINATGDFDVSSDVGNLAGGVVATYVATGGFELKTTEYDKTQSYAPNDFLAPALGDDLGKVTKSPVDWSSRLLCGVVSAGASKEVYNQDVLRFWPVFIPAAGAVTGSSSSA